MTAQRPSPDCQVTVTTCGADSTRGLGRRLACLLRAGDLVLLSGGLGAGKTTLVQGIGSALGVRGRISSPTFVIARTHPAQEEGPDLVHVDAYRLQSLEEVDALDLDSTMDRSVTVVEWGHGRAEVLSSSRLEIEIRPAGQASDVSEELPEEVRGGARGSDGLRETDECREVTVRAVGSRWECADLAVLVAEAG